MADLGFGLMRLPLRDPDDQTSIDMDTLKVMVDEFLDAGFDYFDTAYYYHANSSERAIREALVERHPRSSFRLATKMPMKLLESEEQQEAIFREQLSNCGVEYFDCYLLHNICRSYYPTAERLHTFDFLMRMREEGRIRRLGFSIHDDAEFLERVLDAHGDHTDFVQLQVNYLDWDNPDTQARRCCEVCESRGIPVIVMEPVKGGALAKVPPEVEAMFAEAAPGMSPASWAMRFVGGLGCVETVLSGMTDPDQMRDNIRTMRDFRPLDEREMEVLGKAIGIINAPVAVPCTGCRYCVDDCPKAIAIPEYFSIYNDAVNAPSKGLPPQRFYYMNLVGRHGKASDCIGCGRCEASCPQHLPIREHLRDVADMFEKYL